MVGVTKEIDSLGRICIPKDLRMRFKLEKEVELIATANGILLRNPEYEMVKKSKKQAR